MSKTSQAKGRRGELELVEVLQASGIPARAGVPVNFGRVPDVVGVPGIHPEVKRVEKLNLDVAMSQAVRDAKKFQDGFPTVFHRRNRQPWLVTMRLDDWLELYTNCALFPVNFPWTVDTAGTIRSEDEPFN